MNKQFTSVSLFIGLLLALSAFSASANEDAYGRSSNELPCSHFGWYISTTTFPVSGDIITSQDSDAGDYLIEKVGSQISVTYALAPGFSLNKVSIYASCIDPASIPNTNDICDPGAFPIKEDNPTSPVFTGSFADPGCSTYYFILHAEVGDTCPPIAAIVSGDSPVCPGGTSTLTIDLIGGTAPWSVLLSDGQAQSGGTPPFNFSVTPPFTGGTYQATAVDADGCAATGSFTVVVVDFSPPTLTLKPTAKLFPAKHKYVTLPVTQMVASVDDNCSTLGLSNVVITRVTSDEPEDGAGDGSTTNDIVIAPGCKSVQLRAERAEQLNGRVYSVTLQVKDGEGNVGTAVYKVMVPITSGGTAVEDGALYTVTGCSP